MFQANVRTPLNGSFRQRLVVPEFCVSQKSCLLPAVVFARHGTPSGFERFQEWVGFQ